MSVPQFAVKPVEGFFVYEGGLRVENRQGVKGSAASESKHDKSAQFIGGYLTPPTAHSPTERKKIPPQQNDTKYVENLLTSVEKYTDAFFKSAF